MNHNNRRSIRLQGYDYSQKGAYYVTICTPDRLCLFGAVQDGEMVSNDAGKMIETEWLNLKNRFSNIDLHEYVVMPNHFHGIFEIIDGQPRDKGQPQEIAPTINEHVGVPLVGTQNDGTSGTQNKTVGDMISAFKSITTVEYIRGVKNMQWLSFHRILWQRNYDEHIIRNGNDFERIVDYIRNNPKNCGQDNLQP